MPTLQYFLYPLFFNLHALWLPQMESAYEPFKEEGSVKEAGVNLDEVVWKTGMPEYVWKAGVRSHEDIFLSLIKFS